MQQIFNQNIKRKCGEIIKISPHFVFGGDNRDRTDDLLNAIQALSQLSYIPKSGVIIKSATDSVNRNYCALIKAIAFSMRVSTRSLPTNLAVMSIDGDCPEPVTAKRKGIPTFPMPISNSAAVAFIAS